MNVLTASRLQATFGATTRQKQFAIINKDQIIKKKKNTEYNYGKEW